MTKHRVKPGIFDTKREAAASVLTVVGLVVILGLVLEIAIRVLGG